MSCDVTKFTITKGSDNVFIFTIKQDNSTLPLTIEIGDTFKASLVLLDGDVPYIPITLKDLVVEDALNGKVSLTIPLADTASLVKETGAKVDRYYLRPTYKLTINCVTVNNGKFIAKVDEVFID